MIIAGGLGGSSTLKSVETFNIRSVPDLPVAGHGLTLTAVESLVYSCGGYPTTTSCYRINVEDSNPRWLSTTSLPSSMYDHAAAAVSSHIWFTYHSYLYDLDTETSKFTSYRLPFYVYTYHCAVGNSTHSYIIGGSSYNEVWVNKIPQDPSQWIRVAKLTYNRQKSACLLHDGKIYVSGGYPSTKRYKMVEVIDTKTHKVWRTGDLITGRRYHAMMVLNGNPTVIGGYDDSTGSRLSSIEVLNTTTFKWKMSAQSLQHKRSHFGLAQL